MAINEFARRERAQVRHGGDRPGDPSCAVGRPGRGREDIRSFFTYVLGPQGCKQIRAVAMGMNASFDLEVKMHCPDAEVVYDPFRVVAKYGREVVDRVRVDQANELKNDKPTRQVIKRSRWLLLQNACNIKDEDDRVRLAELLAANKSLAKVYILKDDFKELWDYGYRDDAYFFLKIREAFPGISG